MKKNILLVLALSFSLTFYAQETEKTEEEVIVIEVEDVPLAEEDSIEVPFAVIENVPVYQGCETKSNNSELKKCMSEKITKHILRKFNTDLANNLGLPAGRVRIICMFKIDKEGNVTGIRARAPHPKLEEEAIRVLSLIPQMRKPGYQRGKPVIVPYSLPIVFHVEEDTTPELTKKQLRQLKRQKRKKGFQQEAFTPK